MREHEKAERAEKEVEESIQGFDAQGVRSEASDMNNDVFKTE